MLLIHGLGGSWRSWGPILDDLAAERRVIAVDLPGFGKTPPLDGEVSIATLADGVIEWLEAQDLIGIDVVGSSMGARLVLELRAGVRWGLPFHWTPVVSGKVGSVLSSLSRLVFLSG